MKRFNCSHTKMEKKVIIKFNNFTWSFKWRKKQEIMNNGKPVLTLVAASLSSINLTPDTFLANALFFSIEMQLHPKYHL